MAGRAPETDTSTLYVPSRFSSSSPHRRSGHRRGHHRHKSRRHGPPRRHGESPHRGEFLDSLDTSSRHYSYLSASFGAASHGTSPSHHTYEKVPVHDEHGARRPPGGRPPRPGSEASLSKDFLRDSESSERGAPRASDASHPGRHHHRVRHQHRRPGDSSSHRGASPRPSEHRRGGPRRRHHREPPRPGEHPRGGSRAGAATPPSAARRPSLALGLMRSRSTDLSHASRASSRVHPLEFFSQTSAIWPDEEPEEQRKASRSSRSHKKPLSENLCSKLCGSLYPIFHDLRKMLSVLTESLIFDGFIFIVVCLNIIMIVAQTFANVEVRGEWYFMVFDCIFLSIYVVEALLKIITMGLDYFYDSWNLLDFFIVAMAGLEFTLVQINSRTLRSTVYNPNFFRIFKVFKSLRALRAARILRRLSFLTSLQEVTGTLVRSMPSITAILVLMFTCLFLFSVVLRALFRHSDPNRFQNIFTTIFTLFTLLTLDDWSQIYVDSRANGAWYIIPILMIYIIIQYFIFLNLVIAVLVDNFQMALLRGLEKVKEERAAQVRERLLTESLLMLSEEEPKEVLSDHTKQKLLIEKKFGSMTPKQQELLFHFLQLATGVEHYQQKFRSQASVIDEIVDTAFEAGEEDFRK